MTDNSLLALGRFQDLRRIAVGLMIVVLAVVFSFGQAAYAHDSAAHRAIEMLGLVLIVVGIAGRLWSTLYIGGRKSNQIVAIGPYSVTRNPLYVFSSVAAAGVGAQMGSLTAMVLFCVLCILVFHVVILREESFLRANFGKAFEEYVARVPRFFPNPALYRDEPVVTFDPRLLRKATLDSLFFFVAPLVAAGIQALQQANLMPVLFRLY